MLIRLVLHNTGPFDNPGLLTGNAGHIGQASARDSELKQEYRLMSSTKGISSLKLAKRMRGLGTELSFEMLVRANP
jgi:hypothetical protein